MDQNVLERSKITNIVASVRLTHPIKPHNIPGSLKPYNPRSPQSLLWDSRVGGHRKCIIYPNIGKMMFFGRKSIRNLQDDIHHYTDYVTESDVIDYEIVTCSCVYKLNARCRVDIKRMSETRLNFTYEPELCPAIIIRYKSLTFMLYFNGKLIITGIQPGPVVYRDISIVVNLLERVHTRDKDPWIENESVLI